MLENFQLAHLPQRYKWLKIFFLLQLRISLCNGKTSNHVAKEMTALRSSDCISKPLLGVCDSDTTLFSVRSWGRSIHKNL